MDQAREDWSPHSAHWGAFSARWNGATLDIKPYEDDPAPSSILQNFTTAMRHKARILRPMVRKAWLDRRAPQRAQLRPEIRRVPLGRSARFARE